MSILTHNCECGHPEITHTKTEKGRELCPHIGCGCAVVKQAESIVLDTFSPARQRMPLHAPGTGDGRLAGVTSCKCDSCSALYEAMRDD